MYWKARRRRLGNSWDAARPEPSRFSSVDPVVAILRRAASCLWVGFIATPPRYGAAVTWMTRSFRAAAALAFIVLLAAASPAAAGALPERLGSAGFGTLDGLAEPIRFATRARSTTRHFDPVTLEEFFEIDDDAEQFARLSLYPVPRPAAWWAGPDILPRPYRNVGRSHPACASPATGPPQT